MRAAVLEDYGFPLQIKQVNEPKIQTDGALIEVLACGVCRSDYHHWSGHLDWLGDQDHEGVDIMGHEPVGRVIEKGSNVTEVTIGDEVVIPYHVCCGVCYQCRKGNSHRCEKKKSLGVDIQGAFAEMLRVPDADLNLVKLPSSISILDMASLGCRFMTAFHALVDQARARPGERVAIHGCGGVGLSAIQIADAIGCHVIGIDIRDDKLETAKEMGADAVLNSQKGDNIVKAIREQSDHQLDLSIDAVGNQSVCEDSIRSLRIRGKHIQVGLMGNEGRGATTIPTDEMVTKEISFIPAAGMPHAHFEQLIRMIEDEEIDPSRLISETIALTDINRVFRKIGSNDIHGMHVITEF